jgi:hypothetical protein
MLHNNMLGWNSNHKGRQTIDALVVDMESVVQAGAEMPLGYP